MFITVFLFQAHVRIWDGIKLSTYAVIGIGVFQQGISCLSFSDSDVRYDFPFLGLPSGLFLPWSSFWLFPFPVLAFSFSPTLVFLLPLSFLVSLLAFPPPCPCFQLSPFLVFRLAFPFLALASGFRLPLPSLCSPLRSPLFCHSRSPSFRLAFLILVLYSSFVPFLFRSFFPCISSLLSP